MLLDQVAAIEIAQLGRDQAVGEPGEGYDLGQVPRRGDLLIVEASVLHEDSPAQAAYGEGEVVDDQGRDEEGQVGAADVDDRLGQVDVDPRRQEVEEGQGEEEGEQGLGVEEPLPERDLVPGRGGSLLSAYLFYGRESSLSSDSRATRLNDLTHLMLLTGVRGFDKRVRSLKWVSPRAIPTWMPMPCT